MLKALLVVAGGWLATLGAAVVLLVVCAVGAGPRLGTRLNVAMAVLFLGYALLFGTSLFAAWKLLAGSVAGAARLATVGGFAVLQVASFTALAFITLVVFNR